MVYLLFTTDWGSMTPDEVRETLTDMLCFGCMTAAKKLYWLGEQIYNEAEGWVTDTFTRRRLSESDDDEW